MTTHGRWSAAAPPVAVGAERHARTSRRGCRRRLPREHRSRQGINGTPTSVVCAHLMKTTYSTSPPTTAITSLRIDAGARAVQAAAACRPRCGRGRPGEEAPNSSTSRACRSRAGATAPRPWSPSASVLHRRLDSPREIRREQQRNTGSMSSITRCCSHNGGWYSTTGRAAPVRSAHEQHEADQGRHGVESLHAAGPRRATMRSRHPPRRSRSSARRGR